ncbi:hypothetical protein ACFY2W_33170 [Streptomyces sp. NPDC001262]|uniref:hypothetical protein n=1 Tax=Streptomyces sp. NPDC001262 TaxID=3364552 RepID=UPI0036D182AA
MTVIDPILIPHFTGDVGALEADVSALARAASGVRGAGADIHSTFQGISPAFDTPEREQLLAATLPVRQRGEEFAHQLETVKSALAEYAAEIRPIVEELKRLAEQAAAFQVSISGDDHWRKDQKKIGRNKELIQAVAVAQARFQAAEVACANKINALSCRPAYRADDGTHQPDMYGYKPSDAAKAKSTPWGEVDEREYPAWDVGQMVRGFAVDSVVGMVKGVGALFGAEGEAKAREAWKSMAMLAAGASPSFVWLQAARVMPDSWLPKAGRDFKRVTKESDKGFLAWDQWRANPSRAGGTVAFNGLTSVVPLARAAAATRGASTVGRVLGGVAKVGEVIDPMTHVTNAGGKVIGAAAKVALPQIGDVAAELNRSLGRLDHHVPTPTDHSVKLPSWDDKVRYLEHDGTIRTEHEVEQPGQQARQEPRGAELTAGQEHRVFAHAGGGGGDVGSVPSHSSGGISRPDGHSSQLAIHEPGHAAGDAREHNGGHPARSHADSAGHDGQAPAHGSHETSGGASESSHSEIPPHNAPDGHDPAPKTEVHAESKGVLAERRGRKYEEYLHQKLEGGDSFREGKREFDGSYPGGKEDATTWYEAKSGAYWDRANSDPKVMEKFKSNLGEARSIAAQRGKEFILISENPIPENIVKWLDKKGYNWKIIPKE